MFWSTLMLARIQQLIALSLLASTLAAFAAGFLIGEAWFGWLWIGLAVVGYLGFMAVEFWLLRRSYLAGDAARPTLAQLVRAWGAEVTCAARVFLWQQPFASAREPDHLPASAAGQRGLLLVHGFFCNRGLWNPWLGRLRAADIPFIAVSLEPVFGSIDRYCETIAAAARELERATGIAPVVVAHSMGGLAVRCWLARDPEAPVHRYVTIATPHSGTGLANRRRGALNIAQMAPGSDWLVALAARESTRPRAQPVCFWSHCDNIVLPTHNATLPGADNRHLVGTPHVQMVFHPLVFEEVLRLAGPSV